MKKITWHIIAFVLMGVFFNSVSFAGNTEGHIIAEKCRYTATRIEHLATAQNNCYGDLLIAAANVDAAGLMVKHDKYAQALMSIKAGEHELNIISLLRTDCGGVSVEVKPLIASLIRIESEIEIMRQITEKPLSA